MPVTRRWAGSGGSVEWADRGRQRTGLTWRAARRPDRGRLRRDDRPRRLRCRAGREPAVSSRFGGGRITSNAGALLPDAGGRVNGGGPDCRHGSGCGLSSRCAACGRCWTTGTGGGWSNSAAGAGTGAGLRRPQCHDTLRRDALLAAVVGRRTRPGHLGCGRRTAGRPWPAGTLNRLELAGPGAETDRYKKVAMTGGARCAAGRPVHRGPPAGPRASCSMSMPPTTRCTANRKGAFSTAALLLSAAVCLRRARAVCTAPTGEHRCGGRRGR